MADRYVYVPCIGLFIIIAWGLGDLAAAAAIPRVIPVLAAFGVILALAVVTSSYLPYWQNGVKLFTRAALVANRPDFTIEEALGDALASAGHDTEAYRTTARRALYVRDIRSVTTTSRKSCLIDINSETRWINSRSPEV